jgi:hypothetical protein
MSENRPQAYASPAGTPEEPDRGERALGARTAVRRREDRALRGGAVLVDRQDSAIEPYVVCLLEHDVTDGRSGTTGKPQIVSRRVQYVRADPVAASALDEAGEPGEMRLGSQRRFTPSRRRIIGSQSDASL